MKILSLLPSLGLITHLCLAQTDATRLHLADTTRILDLLTHARACIYKPGELPVDLDSAIHLAAQAEILSRQVGYTRGIQEAALVAANAYIEGLRWSQAWALYSGLSDSSRISFLSVMIRYRLESFPPPKLSVDSAAACLPVLLRLLPALPTARLTGEAYSAIAGVYSAKHDYRRAADYCLEGFRRIRPYKDIAEEAHYAQRMITYFYVLGDTVSTPAMLSVTEQLADDEETLLPRLADSVQRALINNLAYIGNIFYYAKQPAACIRVQHLAIRVNQQLHQHVSLPYSILSYMYTSDGNIKDGLALALDAARVAETPAGPVDGTGYEAVCRVYFVAGDYEKSMEYFYKVLPIFQRAPNLIGNAGGLFHRAIQIRLQQNKPVEALAFLQMITRPNSSLQLTYLDIQYFTISTADCYFAIGKRDSAERYYLRALDLVPDSRYTPSKSLVYNSLAGYFTATGQYARAKPFLDTLMADSNRALNSVTILENAHRLRYKADSAMGNYPAAMAHLLQYGILRDSLTNITRNKQFAEMSVQFETEKKNQHIADLEKQNALQGRLQAITVRQDRIVRNSLIAGAALLILLAAVFYTRSRTRRRMARRLQKLSDRQEKLLREREWLLREIHHRVRNNLQIVISLLRLQSGQFTDATAISAFEEISARVNAISLVHKKLYQEGQDLSSINMREYIRELVGFLQDCLGAQQAIIFTLDIEPLALDVAQCVPLGLILNEAVTNSIKHAFPNGSPPMPAITISLYEEQGWLTACIADNGIGLPAGATLLQTTSLGMQLIHTFTLQLEGTLTIDGNGGAGPAVNREPASNGGAASNGGPGGDAIPAAAMPGLKMEICFPRATPSDAN